MDFMKIIKSLEEFLYELMVWLVFYPRTLWKSVIHPLRLMHYADDELDDAEDDRYSDSLSPPIFLAISLGLVHLIELALQINIATEGLLADDRNLIAFRLVAFALYPLMMSLVMLRARGIALDRKTLRPSFYAQCFLAAPFALGVDVATLFMVEEDRALAGNAIIAATCLWYLTNETIWFARELGVGYLRGALHALAGFAVATILIVVLAVIVSML